MHQTRTPAALAAALLLAGCGGDGAPPPVPDSQLPSEITRAIEDAGARAEAMLGRSTPGVIDAARLIRVVEDAGLSATLAAFVAQPISSVLLLPSGGVYALPCTLAVGEWHEVRLFDAGGLLGAEVVPSHRLVAYSALVRQGAYPRAAEIFREVEGVQVDRLRLTVAGRGLSAPLPFEAVVPARLLRFSVQGREVVVEERPH